MTDTHALQTIGHNIRLIRMEKNLSQETLAFDAGISRSYMGSIERGEVNAGILIYLSIAETLEVKFVTIAKGT